MAMKSVAALIILALGAAKRIDYGDRAAALRSLDWSSDSPYVTLGELLLALGGRSPSRLSSNWFTRPQVNVRSNIQDPEPYTARTHSGVGMVEDYASSLSGQQKTAFDLLVRLFYEGDKVARDTAGMMSNMTADDAEAVANLQRDAIKRYSAYLSPEDIEAAKSMANSIKTESLDDSAEAVAAASNSPPTAPSPAQSSSVGSSSAALANSEITWADALQNQRSAPSNPGIASGSTYASLQNQFAAPVPAPAVVEPPQAPRVAVTHANDASSKPQSAETSSKKKVSGLEYRQQYKAYLEKCIDRASEIEPKVRSVIVGLEQPTTEEEMELMQECIALEQRVEKAIEEKGRWFAEHDAGHAKRWKQVKAAFGEVQEESQSLQQQAPEPPGQESNEVQPHQQQTPEPSVELGPSQLSNDAYNALERLMATNLETIDTTERELLLGSLVRALAFVHANP